MGDHYIRLEYRTREEWLEARRSMHEGHYLMGASEAAKVVNRSPWGSSVDVYDEKVSGIVHDISGLEAVDYGIKAEDPIRQLAALDFKEWFRTSHHPYDILVSSQTPCMSATLDGELEVATGDNPWGFEEGAMGVLEVKTGNAEHGSAGWFSNGGRTIPDHYYLQGIQQLAVTGWAFVIFAYRLWREGYRDGEQELPQVSAGYRLLDRRMAGVEEDIAWLTRELARFEKEHLLAGVRPSQVFRF